MKRSCVTLDIDDGSVLWETIESSNDEVLLNRICCSV